ncbi:hypothetical protein Tdes44962_MAKER06064 [Teratosphaeria destructans]|uniref:MARVEL domain-containing protein n=1 Tax=Teratosphaeria destructans TaxID=418781 RepID=A0A9W7SIB6_9PEZI|nr:hypothetical protein Tdes44962_MAKER06064 [Teratosphaeria destructans]
MALDFLTLHSSSGGLPGALLRIVLRFLQFVFALTVAGLYGVDLHHATQRHAYTDGKWVYAEVCAGFAAVTVLVYALPFLKSFWAFGWDWIMLCVHLQCFVGVIIADVLCSILWTALFGVFGKIYIHAHPTPEQHGQIRMKHAVWIDLINMLLWFITACYSALIFFRARKDGRTLHTGRAKV